MHTRRSGKRQCRPGCRAQAGCKAGEKKPQPNADGKREKRTITEIRDSKKTGEKMVYMSVPDYTSAKWAEMAGVDVAVLGDSLAMISHGHRTPFRPPWT